MNIRTDSTEYVRGTVTTDHDITGVTVSVALPASGQAPTDWHAADTISTVPLSGKWTTTYRLLIGPDGGSIELTPGSYDWTIRVEDTPEKPVRKAGVVIATAA